MYVVYVGVKRDAESQSTYYFSTQGSTGAGALAFDVGAVLNMSYGS